MWFDVIRYTIVFKYIFRCSHAISHVFRRYLQCGIVHSVRERFSDFGCEFYRKIRIDVAFRLGAVRSLINNVANRLSFFCDAPFIENVNPCSNLFAARLVFLGLQIENLAVHNCRERKQHFPVALFQTQFPRKLVEITFELRLSRFENVTCKPRRFPGRPRQW